MPVTLNLFDPQNLEANRRGELTDVQKKQIYAKLSASESLTFMTVTGILAIVGLCIIPSFMSAYFSILNGLVSLLIFVGYLAVLLGWLGFWKYLIKSRRDRNFPSVRQGRGQLSLKTAGYIFDANDGSFALHINDNSGLLPGVTYNAYYLASEKGVLLSVEPIESEDKMTFSQEMSSATAIDKYATLNKILAEVNGFSFEDLKANRNGEITDQQRKKMKSPLGYAIFFGILSVLCFIFAFVVNFQQMDILQELLNLRKTDLFVQGIYAVVIGIGVFGISIFNLYKLRDLPIAVPEQVHGIGKKHSQHFGKSGRLYYYIVAGKQFPVSRDAHTVFVDDVQYHVYYLPHTKMVLSIEATG